MIEDFFMAPLVNTVSLPLELLILPAAFAVLWLLFFRLLRKSPSDRGSSAADEERNWGIPAIDSRAHLSSPFHNWDPRIKIVSLLVFIFCVASITRLYVGLLALLFAIAAAGVARVSLRRTLGRLGAMSVFLGMLLLVMPLTVPVRDGDTLYIFTHLEFVHFNARGLLLALTISLKALSIALLTEPLLASSKFSVTIQALASLKVPRMACQMILLAHRYIFVFQNESNRMRTGMKTRGFRARTDVETLRTIGNFLGMLLVRSFTRTQRVYDAMLARGYTGKLPCDVQFKAGGKDWAKAAFWILAGVCLLMIDTF
ncbi:MAG: cobalt ECF transporter T component CbiQ [Syntrophobacteraceae bacterium]